MKKITVLLLLAAFILLSGCSTFNGFGKDVEKAGGWVQKKSS